MASANWNSQSKTSNKASSNQTRKSNNNCGWYVPGFSDTNQYSSNSSKSTRSSTNRDNNNNYSKSSKDIYVTEREIEDKFTCGICHSVLEEPISPNVCKHV